MMVGMPESTELDEINTAKDLIKLKPKLIRIYPVLVIKGTELAKEYASGEYTPLTVEQAVERCKEISYLFRRKKIDIIRIGLQNTDEITDPSQDGSQVIAGPYHPAFRQLVESSMWYDSVAEKIKNINFKVKKVQITVNPEDVNNMIGHKKENVNRFKEMYDVDIIVKADENMKQGKFEVNLVETY
jgi:histone acetyltransferase (RNA polymerase elongator complex component)